MHGPGQSADSATADEDALISAELDLILAGESNAIPAAEPPGLKSQDTDSSRLIEIRNTDGYTYMVEATGISSRHLTNPPTLEMRQTPNAARRRRSSSMRRSAERGK